jgi:carboxypeptidase Taq
VLQDIHWSFGELGYFPTYTIGNLYAAQLHAAMARELGDPAALVRGGRMVELQRWLSRNVHQAGHRWDAEALVGRVTGSALGSGAFVEYLREKYGRLYGVRL